MATAKEYREALMRMPQDAPCEDSQGFKLSNVQDVLASIDASHPDRKMPHLPRLREDGVVVC